MIHSMLEYTSTFCKLLFATCSLSIVMSLSHPSGKDQSGFLTTCSVFGYAEELRLCRVLSLSYLIHCVGAPIMGPAMDES